MHWSIVHVQHSLGQCFHQIHPSTWLVSFSECSHSFSSQHWSSNMCQWSGGMAEISGELHPLCQKKRMTIIFWTPQFLSPFLGPETTLLPPFLWVGFALRIKNREPGCIYTLWSLFSFFVSPQGGWHKSMRCCFCSTVKMPGMNFGLKFDIFTSFFNKQFERPVLALTWYSVRQWSWAKSPLIWPTNHSQWRCLPGLSQSLVDVVMLPSRNLTNHWHTCVLDKVSAP